jgi:hypothetical protein
MKKTIYLLVCATTLVFALNSCKSSDPAVDTTLQFSTLPVEQQKANVEQNGIDLVNKLDGVKDTKAMSALLSFMNHSNGSTAFLVRPLSDLRTNVLRNNVKTLDVLSTQMRVAANVGDNIWGEWSWSSEINDFVKSKTLVNQAIYHFPADSGSLVNNGELSLTYIESNIVAPKSNPTQNMPSSFALTVKVGTTTVLKANFAATYNTDATPITLSQTLEIEKYNWSIDLSNNQKDVSAKYAFKYDTQVLLKYEIGAAGSFTAKSIEESTGPQDIIDGGYMSIQIMNIALYGGIADMKSMMNEGNALKPDSVIHTQQYGNETYSYTEYIYSKAYYEKEVGIFNKYLKFYAFFVAENQKFADAEFYLVEKNEQYYDYYNYPYQLKTRTVYNAQPRLVLSDGSKVDMSNYNQLTGFEDLIKQLESYNMNF